MTILTKRNLLGAFCALASVAFVPAHADDDIMKNLINKPNAGSWSVFGPSQVTTKVKDPTVQGGGAMQVQITSATPQAWQNSASSPIDGAIKTGDKIVVAVWMKTVASENDAPGQANLRLQINSAPYTGLAEKKIDIGKTWQMYSLETTATSDYAKGATNVSIHLGYAKQTIQLGPVFVLNMGPAK